MKEETDKRLSISTNLQPHQDELLYLGELAGIYMSPRVFRIIVELLNMQVQPDAIFKLLKQIRKLRGSKSKSKQDVPTAVSEAEEQSVT